MTWKLEGEVSGGVVVSVRCHRQRGQEGQRVRGALGIGQLEAVGACGEK